MGRQKAVRKASHALAPAALKQLVRLGATLDAKARIPKKVDTSQGMRPLAGPVATLAFGVRWPRGATYCARDESYPKELEFGTVEAADKGDFYDGVPVIKIAGDGTGFEYLVPVDGGETPTDPPVYRVDHAGPYELDDPEGRLSEFLDGLLSEQAETAEKDIRFADEKLQFAVYKALKGKKKLSRQALAKVRKLHLSGSDRIRSLEGLEQCTQLRELEVPHGVEDLSALARLPQLEVLELPRGAKDLSTLAGLKRLRRLELIGDADLSPLASCTSLRDLRVAGRTESLSALAALTGLEHLDLTPFLLPAGVGTFTDLAPLGALTRLKSLFVFATKVTDLEPLAALGALERIGLSVGDVASLAPLRSLRRLRDLGLHTPSLPDLTPLAGMRSLEVLRLQEMALADLTPLARLASLKELYLAHNVISDPSPLARLPKLTRLVLFDNRIEDLRPLAKMRSLKEVWLGDNPYDARAPENAKAIAALRKRGVRIRKQHILAHLFKLEAI
jgi:internalin A